MTRLPAPAVRPPTRLAVLAFTAALLLVGCGGDGANKTPKVATLQDGSKSSASTSASPSASQSVNADDTAKQLVAFAACMRKNGVQMSDPEVQADGKIEMKASAGPGATGKKASKPLAGTGGGPKLDPNFAKAQKACKQYEPKRGKDIDPQKEAEMQAGALAYAKCMRENGVDMPDPQFDEGGGVTMQMGGGPDQDEAKVKAADKVCRKFLGDRGDGGGLTTQGGQA
ncbi:MAG: hypothetical protein ABI912_09335 [Actinomycetota bacterium]